MSVCPSTLFARAAIDGRYAVIVLYMPEIIGDERETLTN